MGGRIQSTGLSRQFPVSRSGLPFPHSISCKSELWFLCGLLRSIMSPLNPGLLQLLNGVCVYWAVAHLARAFRWPKSCKTSIGPYLPVAGWWWSSPAALLSSL